MGRWPESIRRTPATVAKHPIRSAIALLGATAFLSSLAAEPSRATDGVLEINQTCAAGPGCFTGDAAGYPVTITGAAGRSYRLTSDLVVPNENTNGIDIATSDVGIDLNRFSIIRSGCVGATTNCTPAAGTGSGIESIVATNRGLSVRNGSITGMGDAGVRLDDHSEVLDMRLRWNRLYGASTQNGSEISRCLAYENGSTGILAGIGDTVSGNTAYRNGGDGIFASTGSTVAGNTVFENTDDGIDVVAGSSVIGNSVRANGDDGINTSTTAVVSDNSVSGNGGNGIFTGAASVVSNNGVYTNGEDGIQVGAGSTVQRNSTRANTGFGIILNVDASYRENTVTSNTAGTVSGGVNMGSNSCNGAVVCP